MLVLSLAMASTFAAAATAVIVEPSIAFPDGYQRWTRVKTTLVGPQSPSFATNGGYHHFYANDKAVEGYRTGTFPDGTILVDDGVMAIERDGVSREGARSRVAVMVKDSRRFGVSNSWGFEVFPGDSRSGSLDGAGKAACLACHQRATRDLVFSELKQ